jgi:hypothetical protein
MRTPGACACNGAAATEGEDAEEQEEEEEEEEEDEAEALDKRKDGKTGAACVVDSAAAAAAAAAAAVRRVRGLVVAGGSGNDGGGGACDGARGCDATLPRFSAGGAATISALASTEADDFRFGILAEFFRGVSSTVCLSSGHWWRVQIQNRPAGTEKAPAARRFLF